MTFRALHTVLGDAHYRHGRQPFAMKVPDRLQHLYLVGQTGVGKSTLLGQLARQDAAAGRGLCFLDPHGDLAEELAGAIPDCLYWNPADPACTLGYNPITSVSASYRPLVVSGLIDTLKKQWADAWGPRMEHLLRYALLALMEQPRADLRDVLPLFIDSDFQRAAVARITDPQVRYFWEKEYRALRYKNSPDAVAPIANKLGAFLAHPLVRQAVCEPAEPLRFRRLMDEGRCLIVNLATGRLGADTAGVLGGLILSGVAHAALSRADTPITARRPYFVYADEFHAFASGSLMAMLPQLRKYGVGLTLAHQYLEQVERPLLAAVLGNVGSMMVFRVGASDAPFLAGQLGIEEPGNLLGLANFESYARVMVDGVRTAAFTAYVHAPAGGGNTAETVD